MSCFAATSVRQSNDCRRLCRPLWLALMTPSTFSVKACGSRVSVGTVGSILVSMLNWTFVAP